MALTEQVQLDITQAQRQIDQLDRQLLELGQPIDVPVDIQANLAPLQQIESSLRELAGVPVDVDVDTADLSQAQRDILEMAQSLDRAGNEADDFQREIKDAGDEAERTGRKGKSAFDGLGDSIKKLALSAVAFVGLREVVRFFNDAIQAASDLEESTSKAQVVFGNFFDDIEAFASTAPQALGLANAQALEFTGTFGNLFTALGLSQQAAADLAPEIVQLGADLASFNNIEVTEALDKLRAGLVGEAEPLRTLGVNINAAVVEAKALELGLAGATGEISEAAKVQARYALILEQTTNAQGDFARTADGIANQQRTLNAVFEEFRSEIGQALLPAFQSLLDAAPQLLAGLDGLAPVVGLLGEAFGTMATEAGIGAQVLGLILDPITDIADAIDGIDAQPLANLSQTARELANIDQPAGLSRFIREAQLFLDTGLDFGQVRDIFEDLSEAVDSGVPSFSAASSAIEKFAQSGTLTEDLLRGITESLELTSDEAARLRIAAREGLFGDLTVQEIETLNRVLGEFIDTDARFAGRETAGGRFAADFAQIGPVINDTIPVIDQFSQAVFEAGQAEFQLNIEGEIARLEQQFAQLPSAFDGVREAFRNDENEIVSDFGDFADNLIGELEAQLDFVANLDLLREMGFDDLADQFAELGIESAGLLADGLADPSALAEAETALDAYERAIDEGLRAATTESVAAAIGSIGDLTAALESLEDVSITASVFLELTGPGAQFAGSFGTGSGRTSELVGGQTQVPTSNVTVNQTFTDPTTPSTTTARASQSINGLVSGPQ